VIDNLTSNYLANPNVGLAWFYCDGNANQSCKADKRYIFGSLFYQLCKRLLDTGGNRLIAFMEDFQAKYRNATDTELTEGFTHAIPELSFESESGIYIVIDGIDECPDPAKLCEQFLQIARGQVRVLVTSRSGLRDIDQVFQGQPHVLFGAEQSSRDIAIHIEWSFETDKRLKKVKPDLKNEIKGKLLSKSEGM
jgi:hypothetical protein